MISLKHITDHNVRTVFSKYFIRRILIFDSPVFCILNREWNPTNEYMAKTLTIVGSQHCPIRTESPWSIETNKSSGVFLYCTTNKTVNDNPIDITNDFDVLQVKIEMVCNIVQHVNHVIPHFNRFGEMPYPLGHFESTATACEGIALMELARDHTEQSCAEQTIFRALDFRYRYVTDLRLFEMYEKLWLYPSNHGWKNGTVVCVPRLLLLSSTWDRQIKHRRTTFALSVAKSSLLQTYSLIKKQIMGYWTNLLTEKTYRVYLTLPQYPVLFPFLTSLMRCSLYPKDLSIFHAFISTDENMIVMHVNPLPCGNIDSELVFH